MQGISNPKKGSLYGTERELLNELVIVPLKEFICPWYFNTSSFTLIYTQFESTIYNDNVI